jgi:hypothetical protein
MPKKVPNIQGIINNDILKIVNIVFSKGGGGGGSYSPEKEPWIKLLIYKNQILKIL